MSESDSGMAEFGMGEKLAFERTRLAYERTMMAWIRTATALIAFGFAIYKIFQMMPLAPGLKPGQHVVSPRAIAFLLAFLGDVSLLFAAFQHRANLQRIRALGLKVPYSLPFLLATFLAIVGIVVLLMVLFRV